jgi:protein-disulfide isomerase
VQAKTFAPGAKLTYCLCTMKQTFVFCAFVAMSLTGCKNNAASSNATPAGAAENSNQVVATYNGTNLTLKEVDDFLGDQLKELDKQKLKMRQSGIEQTIIGKLVDAEAKKVGLTTEAWMKANIEDKVPEPAEADIKKVFEENKAQMPAGTDFEQIKPRIVQFLKRTPAQELASKLFKEMKDKANVKVLLKEPKVVVEAVGPSRGPSDAKVTIVEFSDFQCPFCSRAEPVVDQIMAAHAGKVRIVFRQYPLPIHAEAPKAAEASLCANEQGKFWEMHKQLFANQSALKVEDLKNHAKTLQLDSAKFDACLDTGKFKSQVDADLEAGRKAGVNGTPEFFVNGTSMSGAVPFEEFDRVIKDELASSK